jgi:hypothetical protein
LTISNDYGRAVFEKNFSYRYVSVDAIPLDSSLQTDPLLFAWVSPEKWGLFPDLRGRRVAIVANNDLVGWGRKIDSCDEVIRINRMDYWTHHPENDGTKVTIWAGLPKAPVIAGASETAVAGAKFPSCFTSIAKGLSLIWSVTPFHISPHFADYLIQNDLSQKLFVSGSSLFFYDHLMRALPADLFRALYTIPPVRVDPSMPVNQFNFELLLTGVRIVLFCMLAGATEIGLFGFDFYSDSKRRPWAGHDLTFNEKILAMIMEYSTQLGCRIENHNNPQPVRRWFRLFRLG